MAGLCALLLSGCGGGSGAASSPAATASAPTKGGTLGSGTLPTAPPSNATGTSFTLSATTLAVQAPVNQAAGPTATVSLSIVNGPSTSYYIGGYYSTKGIASVAEDFPTGGPPGYILSFKPPYQLAPGTYSDTLELELCADAACNQPITPLQSVKVTYAVTAAPADSLPAAVLSTAAVTFQASLAQYPTTFPSPPSVTIAFNNVPVSPTVTVASSQNGIESVYYAETANDTGSVTIYLKSPQSLGAGTYKDTVTVTACLDAACVNPVSASPITFTVAYTVTNIVGGANGYTINTYPIVANDLLWDAVHQQLLVSLPASAQVDPGSVAVLDPQTGALSAPTVVAGTPGVMAISADGSYLYVGLTGMSAVQRYVLPGMTPDILIQLPNYDANEIAHARTIDVAPDNPHTIAVTMTDDSSNTLGLVIFDDAVSRPDTFGYTTVVPYNVISSANWGATSAALYGADGDLAADPDLYAFSVNAAGVQLTQHLTRTPPGKLHFAQNLLYTDDGSIVDPSTLATTGSFAAPLGNLFMTPDVALQRAFFVNNTAQSSSSSGSQLESYDLATQAAIATVPLPNQIVLTRRLVRWGTNGLIFSDATHNQLVVVSGAFVAP